MAAWLCLALFQGAFAAAAFSAEEAGGDSDLPLSLLQTRTYQTCTYTGAAEEVAPLQRLQTIPETIPEIARPSRLAVFVQAANASLFADARRCVEQVAAAQVVLAGTTNVFVAALNHADAARFSKEMEYLPAQVTVEVFQNRGADVGLFLQQLQGRPLNYDFILKIHTKSSNVLREHALSQLCGDTDVVKQVLAHFHAEPRLQMVGPQGLVLENASDFSTIERLWDDRNVKFALWPWEERAAEVRAWPLLSGKHFPHRNSWTIMATNFYWMRSTSLACCGRLLRVIPELVATMPFGYVTGSSAQMCHVLERLIPTMVRASGGIVAEI